LRIVGSGIDEELEFEDQRWSNGRWCCLKISLSLSVEGSRGYWLGILYALDGSTSYVFNELLFCFVGEMVVVVSLFGLMRYCNER